MDCCYCLLHYYLFLSQKLLLIYHHCVLVEPPLLPIEAQSTFLSLVYWIMAEQRILRTAFALEKEILAI